ncbi:hypothetical protein [Symbioplanes lichenis]|uniref:hypothetical protein n=1 Tax=Symbioplanes lichenis TaxID=1629072 RepID=UPI0027385603|nr:hypothetical protein [Actinoplanes lichenis]
MTMDLTSTVKLLHRVFEFLASRSAAQLTDLATGRATLDLAAVTDGSPGQDVAADSPAKDVGAGSSAKNPLVGAQGDYSAIIAELRGQPSVADGAAYLNKLQLNGRKATKADLIALAAAAGLTLPPATLKSDAVRKLVEHAIGTHRKYAGLSSW